MSRLIALRRNFLVFEVLTIDLIQVDNSRNTSCQFPTFYFEDGTVLADSTNKIPADGCKASDFDQYGDLEAFGVHPDWMRQLTKFASVQDRLREWQSPVMEKLIHFACLSIKALDYDGIRIDKATQVSVDGLATWTTGVRKCAQGLGEEQFLHQR
jgi:alpha-1,3-glucan synthase